MAGFPPKKNTAFTFHTALVSQADTDIFKTSPTLAAGDITVSIDGGNYANIGTLPTQIQSSGVLPVALTAAEMNGDVINVLFHDASGSEWQDQIVCILTDAIQLSDIESQTDDIGTAGAGLTAIPWNASWDAEVQSEATDALNAYDPPTNAEMEARTIASASYFDPAVDTVDVGKISGDSVAADNLETATDGGVYNVGGGGIVASNVSLGLTADESASLKLWLATLGYLNYEAEHALLPATINALNDITPAQVNAEVVDALTVDVIADSVATDGTRPTIAQALLEITRFLMERSVTSTTMTVKKEDGTTSSMTFTLDSATAPTAITRAS